MTNHCPPPPPAVTLSMLRALPAPGSPPGTAVAAVRHKNKPRIFDHTGSGRSGLPANTMGSKRASAAPAAAQKESSKRRERAGGPA